MTKWTFFIKQKWEDLEYLTKLVEKGKLKSVIDKTHSFDEIVLAHEYYE
ncbi:MAG: zinc-binding dehydrogenase [Promethearchaeota archaeon]